MSYIGKEYSYGVFEKQILTGDGSSTLFTLGRFQLLVVLY